MRRWISGARWWTDSEETSEEVSVHLSQDFDAFYAQPFAPLQPTGDKGKLLVITRWQGYRDAPQQSARGHAQGHGARGA